MTDNLQPGQHLDADQLSAFAEGVLPAHERDATLAHLAGCAHCREIVQLALPPVEEAPVPQPEPARRPWFAGWSFVWPTLAAGCAALLVFAVYMHHAPGGEAAPPSVETAVVNAPLPPPGEATLAPSRRTEKMAMAPAAAPAKTDASSVAGAPAPPAAAVQGSVIDSAQIENLPIQGRSYTALQPQAEARAEGRAQDSAAESKLAQNKAQQQATALGSVGAAASPPAKVPAALPAPAAPAAAEPATAASLSADTVEVNASANAVETTSAISVASVAAPRLHKLPSQLAVASAITRDSLTLAADTAGALFLSMDSGRHWKSVAVPWPGRAVQVTLASFAAPPAPQAYAMRANAKPAPAAAIAGTSASGTGQGIAAAPSTPGAATAAISGTVTDASGASIPGATVTLSNAATNATRTTRADKTGRYAFGGVAAGNYTLAVSAPGFEEYRQTGVEIAAAAHAPVDVRLRLGSASETVTVNAGAAEVDIAREPARKRVVKAKSVPVTSSAFEVTTDNGEHWTSADGQSWVRK